MPQLACIMQGNMQTSGGQFFNSLKMNIVEGYKEDEAYIQCACARWLMMSQMTTSLEPTRTHGMAKPTVYANFHRVIHALNAHTIICDNSPTELKIRSDEFKEWSSFDLFQFCTGAIDGQADYIIDCTCAVLK
jgi:hypothetical protein